MRLEELSQEQREKLRDEVLPALRKAVPAAFLGLNVAQRRALRNSYTVGAGGQGPFLSVVAFANGVGKTHLMWLDVIGWTKGPEFLNWRAFPEEAVAAWAKVRELRDAGLLSLRIVCSSDDMKAGGSVYVILKELIPEANPTALDTGKCYRQIDIPHPTLPKVKNSIAVKTFDQDEIKHSGSTCHRIWVNEPLPANLVGETISRTRAKGNNPDGTIMMCATLLDHAEWVEGLATEGKNVVFSNGHLYENCKGNEVTDEMADEVRRVTGFALQKGPDGHYITGGVLSKSSIENMILGWKKSCHPLEVEARKTGKFMHHRGRIFPQFNVGAHRVKDAAYWPVPRFPVVQIVDPHSAKDDFSVWLMCTPNDRLIGLAEWPTAEEYGPYESMDRRHHTIAETCEIWRKLESDLGISQNVVRRIGDPNRFRDPNPRTQTTLAYDYAIHGFNFDLGVSDNLDVGERRINDFLYYDELRWKANPNDPMGWPRLMLCERMTNTIVAMQNFAMKVVRDPDKATSEIRDRKYECPVACVRYGVMGYMPYSQMNVERPRMSDVEAINIGRLPPSRRPGATPGLNPKGRRLVLERSFR